MRLIIDQSLAVGFIPINTRQQRASLPFKPGVLVRKAYNNDDITFFSILRFAKPWCDNVLQPKPAATSVVRALPGKLDIIRHSPSIPISWQALRCQQAFSKPCLVNLISKVTHLVLSISRN